MATKIRKSSPITFAAPDLERISVLSREDPISGVAGPGRWLVAEYQPTSLFSLKTSQATSSVGVTLVVPTPYGIKMAFVDAAFRAGLDHEQDYDGFLRSLAGVDLRIAPARTAVVTNTFLKIRQEIKAPSKKKDQSQEEYREALIQKLCSAHPAFIPDECQALSVAALERFLSLTYDSSVAYRELVHLEGVWLWAFDLACGDDLLARRLVRLAPYISYVGKRGSFVQYRELHRRVELGGEFTQPLLGGETWPADRVHVRPLDDFGPEANLEALSSFTSLKPKREKHRRFVPTIIPIGIVSTGPGFSEYRRD
jgi:hypothetical protein